MNIRTFLASFLAIFMMTNAAFSQDDLINKIKNNQTDGAARKFQFSKVFDTEATSIKDQASSSTCWSYATLSFLESEIIRMGRPPVDLAEMFVARNQYIDKAEMYVRLHGGLSYGTGGSAHDILYVYDKYGLLPQDAYTGLNYGTDRNNLGEMENLITSMLKALTKDDSKKLTPVWKKAFSAVVDTYLGEVPKTFTYQGKQYTPRTFADQVVNLKTADYVEFSSFTTAPYWQKTLLAIPDNWTFGQVWNVPMHDLTSIIDYALSKGYSVAWSTDVSEKSFSWKNGVAYIPAKPFEMMNSEERAKMFDGPQPEADINDQLRQQEFDNYQTTDDHGMQITGLYKDQNGKEYYKVKNSWGISNDNEGYLYVTKKFVQMKTTSMLLHKDGVPAEIKKMCKI